MDDVFVGVDVGTGSIRSVMYDAAGGRLAEARRDLYNRYIAGGGAEQDADGWRTGMAATLRECMDTAGIPRESIRAIGLDGTSGTVVPVDQDGSPLTRSLLWMDTRSHREMDAINATGDKVLEWAGGQTSSEWVISKILWIKNNLPDIYAKTWKFLEPPDFLLHHLTGELASSYSNAVHKRHYVESEGGWPNRLLDSIGLADLVGKWPTAVKRCWEPAGFVSGKAAAEFGLPEGIPVVNAGNDGPAAMIGLGVLRPGDIAATFGTSTCFLFFHDAPSRVEGFWGPYPGGVFPDYYVYDVGLVSSGSVIEWLRRILFEDYARNAGDNGFDLVRQAAEALPPGSGGIHVLDYWRGNRTPHNDPTVRGAIWGLSLEHRPEHLYRAILEATAFGARQIFEIMRANGMSTRRIAGGGGGSRNRLWMQIHADVLEQPIVVTQTAEACALGCSMGGAVAAGRYPDLMEAAKHMVRDAETIQPQGHFDQYREAYEKYVLGYEKIKPLS
ncbi:MAG: hypothetical protein LBJ46_02570 [Planctomycetota bacterium]|jgi:FGGY-family pentulose kinase|nr:hypothetical protein [Planctomycetota bacterium]